METAFLDIVKKKVINNKRKIRLMTMPTVRCFTKKCPDPNISLANTIYHHHHRNISTAYYYYLYLCSLHQSGIPLRIGKTIFAPILSAY